MEEVHRARHGEGMWNSVLEGTLLLNLQVFTNWEVLRILFFWNFMEASLHRHEWPWIDSLSNPSPHTLS